VILADASVTRPDEVADDAILERRRDGMARLDTLRALMALRLNRGGN